MAKNEVIAALDIGTTKICALIAEVADNGELLILGAGVSPSTGMQKGVVVDIEATAVGVEDALSKASRQAGRKAQSVVVGVTGEHIASLNSVGRVAITHPSHEITRADVEKVMEASRVIVLPPDRQILHAIPRFYSVDGQSGINRPVGMSGTRLEVHTHIVHGATTFLKNVEKCVTRAGYQVASAVLEPIATAESVLLAAEKDLGVCLVDIGGGTSDVAVFEKGAIIYSGVVPVGGNHVTNDLAYGLTLARDEAERVKTQSGSALDALVPEHDVITLRQVGRADVRKLRRRALVQIIQPRMRELFELVRDQLEAADCDTRIPAGMVISGGGSRLTGCIEVAEQVMKTSVRIGIPHGAGGIGDTLTHPMYATAVGLAQYRARELRAAHTARTEDAEAAPATWRTLWRRIMQYLRMSPN